MNLKSESIKRLQKLTNTVNQDTAHLIDKYEDGSDIDNLAVSQNKSLEFSDYKKFMQ